MASTQTRSNSDLTAALADAESRFAATNPKSRARAEAAAHAMPGGNTRTVLHYTPFPLALANGSGCRLTDLDGHTYADYLGEFTAGLYGHSDPRIAAAIAAAVSAGLTLGGPNQYEGELAALICKRFPSMERLRFCNSGTEANLFAISAARVHTGRTHVMVFGGGYHGGVFYFGQAGSPINAPFPWVMAPYNDAEAALALIARHAGDLASVVVEPMLGTGCIPASREFLLAIREACTRCGAVLHFDEVMTSRLSSGGLQKLQGITPDMTTLGKYLGGGASFGAFGGRADIMERFNPYNAGFVAHAGTFNNNVLSMAAGLAALRDIYTAEAAEALTAAGDTLRQRLTNLAEARVAGVHVAGRGSMMTVHLQRGPIDRPQAIWHTGDRAKRQAQLSALFHLDMLAAGQYLARRGFISLSLPMTAADHDRFAAAFEEFLTVRRPLLD